MFTSSEYLECATCAGEVVMCIDADKTVSNKSFIIGIAASVDPQVLCNGSTSYVYGFTYEETQLIDPDTDLVTADIHGVLCKGCLTSYIDTSIGTDLGNGTDGFNSATNAVEVRISNGGSDSAGSGNGGAGAEVDIANGGAAFSGTGGAGGDLNIAEGGPSDSGNGGAGGDLDIAVGGASNGGTPGNGGDVVIGSGGEDLSVTVAGGNGGIVRISNGGLGSFNGHGGEVRMSGTFNTPSLNVSEAGIRFYGKGSITELFSGSTTWDPPNILNGAQANTTISVPGVTVGDYILVSFERFIGAGLFFTGVVSANDVVTVTLFNISGIAVDLPSTLVRAAYIRII